MEPISHEGLGRLLKLDSNLQTPHIVFSRTGMEEMRATSEQNISVGTKVKVVDAEGITVTVMPLEGEE